jgi:peptidoglycan/xylan/chitin deacetylase (PgdA/CDA1 family)
MSRKEFLASTLERTGLGNIFSRTLGRWNGLLVFNYHRVGDPQSTPFDRGIYSASQEEFDRQVTFLQKHCDLVRIADLEQVLERRTRAVLITFDDGYRDNYEFAFPVLSARNAGATFFLTSGFLDDGLLAWWDEIAWMLHSSPKSQLAASEFVPASLPLRTPEDREQAIGQTLRIFKSLPQSRTQLFLNQLALDTGSGRCPREQVKDLWMTWDMVREMDRAGMDLGGHTVSHPVLSRAPVETQRHEINTSKQRIEAEAGHPITAFSYPVGQPDSFTEQTRSLLQAAGYRWAFSFSGGFSTATQVDTLNLPRVAVAPHISHDLFRSTARLPWLFA